jgi:hypothetical protein
MIDEDFQALIKFMVEGFKEVVEEEASGRYRHVFTPTPTHIEYVYRPISDEKLKRRKRYDEKWLYSQLRAKRKLRKCVMRRRQRVLDQKKKLLRHQLKWHQN